MLFTSLLAVSIKKKLLFKYIRLSNSKFNNHSFHLVKERLDMAYATNATGEVSRVHWLLLI